MKKTKRRRRERRTMAATDRHHQRISASRAGIGTEDTLKQLEKRLSAQYQSFTTVNSIPCLTPFQSQAESFFAKRGSNTRKTLMKLIPTV